MMVSSKAGNWSDPSIWPDGIIPGANGRVGDVVSIDDNVTIDMDVTLGTNTKLTTCLFINQYAAVNVTAGHTLTVRGNVIQRGTGSNGQPVNFNSANLVFDSTRLSDPSQNLTWQVVDGYSPTPGAIVNFNGTSTAPCFVRSTVGGGIGMFTNGGNFGGGQVTATYTRFYRLGDATHIPFGMNTDYRAVILSFDHCQFDTCGEVTTAAAAAVNRAAELSDGRSSFIVTNCAFVNSLAIDPLRFWSTAARTTGVWNISNNSFDVAPTFVNNAYLAGLTQTGNTIGSATGLTITPGGGSVVGSPATYTVALRGGAGLSGTVRVTPHAASGTGAFSPAYVDLTNSTRSASFTYTAASAGSTAILLTNDGNLVDPPVATYVNTATAYTVTAPATLTAGIDSGFFTVALNGATSVPVTVTPASVDGGTFLPASVVLDATHNSAVFTYKPASAGTKTITFSNSGTLANASGVVLMSNAATAAPATYALTGPSGGDVGKVSGNFTVTLGSGSVAGTIRLRPTASNGDGTFTPAYVDLTDSVRSATFTYEPSKWSVRTISLSNDSGLANPSGVAYVSKVQTGNSGTAPVNNYTPDMGGFNIFANGPWLQDIAHNVRTDVVASNSAAIITQIGGAAKLLRVEFGQSSALGGTGYSQPLTIVPGTQAAKPSYADAYWSESDVDQVTHAAQIPIPTNVGIEGWYDAGGAYPPLDNIGDAHIMLGVRNEATGGLDTLWEGNDAHSTDSGATWHFHGIAKFNLATGAQRHEDYTSADAAGLPIAPLLYRYDEAAAALQRNDHLGVGHPIRICIGVSQTMNNRFVWPAKHGVGGNSAGLLPMGSRLRISSDWYNANAASFTGLARVMVDTMYQNGVIVADISTYFSVCGVGDDRWDQANLNTVGTISAAAFEALAQAPEFTFTGPTSGVVGTNYTFTMTRVPGYGANFAYNMYEYDDMNSTNPGSGVFVGSILMDDAHKTVTIQFKATRAGTHHLHIEPVSYWLRPLSIDFVALASAPADIMALSANVAGPVMVWASTGAASSAGAVQDAIPNLLSYDSSASQHDLFQSRAGILAQFRSLARPGFRR